jgi:hypothetical protein
MKKIILGIFVFMSFLLNAQEHKMEDNALTRMFEAKGKTKPQSIQQDLTALKNRAISPLRLDRDVEVYFNVNSIQYKRDVVFDFNGNPIFGILYSWSTTTQSFVPSLKAEGTYDANGNLILYIDYDWNTDTQSLVPLFKDVRTYNNGLPISFLNQLIVYKWNSDLGIYKPSFKTEYATILDNNTQLHRKGVLYQYDTNFNVWDAFVGDEYNSYEYYTKTALSTETIDNNLISIYPNPTSNLLYVSHPELNSLDIQITDLSGRQMYLGAIQKEVPLNVSSYAKGIYLVTVENKETNKKKTYKIIKK